MPLVNLQEELVTFLKNLQQQLITDLEILEPQARFEKTSWEHREGGGGTMALLRGAVFEKAAVNFSAVSGANFPMQDSRGPFFATGVSLITHMANPHAPTAHFNIRYIATKEKRWLAGGYDLTPMGFPYREDTSHFHQIAQKALAPFGEGLYATFSQNAKTYFYIPHYQKERGAGGIFFDHYDSGDWQRDLAMWKEVGRTFSEAIIPIYQRRIDTPYTLEEKERQLKARAHYVEFNLLYDRGTQFGFRSKGNPEAILCSMPPLVKW